MTHPGSSHNLDMVRAIAVSLVVGSHIAATRFEVESVGRVGVAVFFVHTSLVLMQSLERTGAAALPFYTRRAFRIYPLSVVIVAMLALANWLGGVPLSWAGVASNLALVQNITGHQSILAPLWSLPYEVQMYLTLPALHLLARRTNGATRVAGILASSVVVLAAAAALGVPTKLLAYVPCFLSGVLAYALPRRAILSPLWLVAIIAAAAVAVPALEAAGAPETPLLWGLCLALGFAIPACREVRASIVTRPASIVAKYSYGIYLTHLFAIFAGFRLFPSLPAWGSWLTFAVVLAALARVAYSFVEAPGIALGGRIAARTGLGARVRVSG